MSNLGGTLHPVTQKWLTAAEYAKADPTLIPNHRGTVDKALVAIMAENTDLLNRIAGCADIEDVEASLEAENAAIKSALEVYA